MKMRTKRTREPADDRFSRFVASASPSLLRTAYLLLGDWPSAEDAIQIALLRTYRHWERIESGPDGYVWTVVVNACRDEVRRRKRRPEIATDPAVLPERTSGEPAAEEAVLDRYNVAPALRQLPQRQRELLVLRYLIGLSAREVAVIVGAAEGTVRSGTSRALDGLRQALATEEVLHVER